EGVAVEAALLAKSDLVTATVGEFPELQGIVGGLLLRAEGAPAALSGAVAEHYKPVGADDSLPTTDIGCIVSVADRLDTIAGLLRAGESPTGSRDPFGLRRATSGLLRIIGERSWPLSIDALYRFAGQSDPFYVFLRERLALWLIDRGFTPLEVA